LYGDGVVVLSPPLDEAVLDHECRHQVAGVGVAGLPVFVVLGALGQHRVAVHRNVVQVHSRIGAGKSLQVEVEVLQDIVLPVPGHPRVLHDAIRVQPVLIRLAETHLVPVRVERQDDVLGLDLGGHVWPFLW
jgi:hypothetical protein